MLEQTILLAMLRASDSTRRSVGFAFDQFNMGAIETEWRVVLSEPGFTLRRYGEAHDGAPAVLLIPAPIKRAYIFDLMPLVSVVRRCLEGGFAVYLMDGRQSYAEVWGLAQYAIEWIGTAVQVIAGALGIKPALVGHSIGGTFAAIFAAAEPERIQKLLLLEAPLRFGAETGSLALMVGSSGADVVAQLTDGAPGSLLDVASCAAAPEEFIVGRWHDAGASLLDPEALSIHLRVIRWTLDEFEQPRRLFADIIAQLYRADAFARGELRLAGQQINPAALTKLPVAAVIDRTTRLVPYASALAPLARPAVFEYVPEAGVALQHVGPLVGRQAHRELWPRLIAWLRA
jgi:polyhydroxyalkanoate synthase